MNFKISKKVWLAGIVAGCFSFQAVHGGTYFQDFSGFSTGTTSFGDGSQLLSDHLGSVARVQDNTFRELGLTAAGVANRNTRSAFKLPALDGVPVVAFSAKWNSQIYGNASSLGEGFSLNFGQLNSLDLISTNYAQESGYSTGLCFSVQTSVSNNPGFYIRIGTNTVASQAFHPGTQWGSFNIARHFWEVDWHYLDGLTVRLNHTNIFTNVPTVGFVPHADDCFVWAARTGESTQETRLDNVVMLTTGNLSRIPVSNPHSSTTNSVPSHGFDDNPNTAWIGETNGFLGASVPFLTVLWAYTITSGPSADRATDPKDWRIESPNGVIDTLNRSASFLNPMETRALPVYFPYAGYTSYRLKVETNNGSPLSTAIGDLRFYGFQPAAYSMAVATAPILSSGPLSLRGTINPSNFPVNAMFEWGTTTNYGNVTPVELIPATNAGVAVSVVITNYLVDGETYHYRLVGSNSLAVAFGQNATFSVIKPTVVTMPINVRRFNSAHLGGFVDPHINYLTYSWLQWGLTTNYDQVVIPILPEHYSDRRIWGTISNLSPGTTYHYRAVASNGFGVVYGDDVAFTTGTSDIPWTIANVESNNWKSIALSADGTKMIAAGYKLPPDYTSPGLLYISTNSGADWTSVTSAPSRNWMGVASSWDGTKLVAVSERDPFNLNTYPAVFAVSTNSGATWILRETYAERFMGAASSADGNRVCAVSYSSTFNSALPGNIYYSRTNSVSPAGHNWVSFHSEYWRSIAMTADGKMLAGGNGLYFGDIINLSTPLPLVTNVPQVAYKSVAISADGTRWAAIAGTQIYLSTNAGATWTTNVLMDGFPSFGLYSIAMSADGTRIVVADEYSGIYVSMDSGATWLSLATGLVGEQWKVAISADGSTVAAAGVNRDPAGVIVVGAPIFVWHLPSVKSEITGNQLAISWTTNQTGLVLQTTTNLTAPNWVATTNGITITDGQYRFLMTPGAGNRFFRLVAP